MKRVKSVWLLIILAILLGCASSPIRKGYLSGEGKTIEVSLHFLELFPYSVISLYLSKTTKKQETYYIRVEHSIGDKERKWSIHTLAFQIDSEQYQLMSFKEDYIHFGSEAMLFESSLEFIEKLYNAQQVKIQVIGSGGSKLLEFTPYHHEKIGEFLNYLEQN